MANNTGSVWNEANEGAASYYPTARFGLICSVKKSLNTLQQLDVELHHWELVNYWVGVPQGSFVGPTDVLFFEMLLGEVLQ